MSSATEASPWRLIWTDELSVCVPEIDAEHKHFILLVNALNNAIISRMGIEEIKICMRALLDDGIAHFAHEEKLFEEWGYPDAAEHVQKHAEVLQYFRKIINGFEQVRTDFEWIEVGLQVKKALIGHLLVEDMKYRDFCLKRGKC